jgi:CBS domain-containing protein
MLKSPAGYHIVDGNWYAIANRRFEVDMDEEVLLEEEAVADERAAEAAHVGAAILHRPIRQVATMKPAVCVAPGATIRAAIESMNQRRVGCVLVAENARLLGIFTERDVITKVVAANVDIDKTSIDAVMSRDPESLSPDDRISFALNKMSAGGFRRIPLVDDSGRLAGLVTMRNVVDYLVDLFPTEVLNLPPEPRQSARTREGA